MKLSNFKNFVLSCAIASAAGTASAQAMPSIDAAMFNPAAGAGIMSDFQKSFENGSAAVPALIEFGAGANPYGLIAAGSAIGTGLGVGIFTTNFPILDPIIAGKSQFPDVLFEEALFSNFGAFAVFPEIPLITAPLGGL